MSEPFIAVVEDDHALRTDLVDFLQLRGFGVAGAASAAQLWKLLTERTVNLVLLDIGLPDQSGLSIAAQLSAQHPHTGIVMLTAFSEDTMRLDGLARGADAYLVKNTSLEVIEATCRSVLRRLAATAAPPASLAPSARTMPAEASAQIVAAPTPDCRSPDTWELRPAQCALVGPNGRSTPLTVMEFGFLQAVMATPGQPLGRTDLLAALDKPDTVSNRRNLDGCAARLRRKVSQTLGCELPLRSFYARGYVFTGMAA